jgi:hypothetical protein
LVNFLQQLDRQGNRSSLQAQALVLVLVLVLA